MLPSSSAKQICQNQLPFVAAQCTQKQDYNARALSHLQHQHWQALKVNVKQLSMIKTMPNMEKGESTVVLHEKHLKIISQQINDLCEGKPLYPLTISKTEENAYHETITAIETLLASHFNSLDNLDFGDKHSFENGNASDISPNIEEEEPRPRNMDGYNQVNTPSREVTMETATGTEFPKEESMLETLTKNMPGLFFVLSKEQLKFLYRNDNWVTITGFTNDQLDQMSVADCFLKGGPRKRFEESIAKAFEKGFCNLENIITTKNGSKPYFFSTVRIEINDKPYIVGTGIDISEQKFAEELLRKKAEEIALANKFKSEFLANMSHELRTPLNSIIILSKLLADDDDGKLGTKHKQFAKTIYSSGADLLNLINDILDLSKIESGNMEINKHNIDISALLRDIETKLLPLTIQKGLSFHLEIKPNLPQFIISDEKRLRQILTNLLSNAVKFTQSGQITLKVYEATTHRPELLDQSEHTRFVAFTIHDTGIGIKSEQLDFIFEAFKQADGTTNRQYSGTGLGLTISRKLAQSLGGHLKVESTPGEGSTFIFLMPLVIGARTSDCFDFSKTSNMAKNKKSAMNDNGISTTIQPLLKPQFKGRKILLVEDDMRNVYTLMALFNETKLDLLVSDSGEHALKNLQKYPDIDLVLLDMMLPKMNGYDAARSIRENLKLTELPIIALTASVMKGEKQRCLDAGANYYMAKPLNSDILIKKIAELLNGSPQPKAFQANRHRD